MEIRHEADEYEARLADVVGLVRNTVRRRWLTLLIVTGVVFALGVLFVSTRTPLYTATERVRIDPSRNPLANNPQQDRNDLAPEAIETEVTAIKSIDLATAIVRDQDLVNDPEFAEAAQTTGATDLSKSNSREAAVATALLRQLSVSREKLTYVVDVEFTSNDPIKAANLAHSFAQGYIQSKIKGKVDTAEHQADWFKDRMTELGDEARAADAKVADFRARTGIIENSADNNNVGTIADQQVAPLSASLATAESDAAGASSNLNAARAQASQHGMDSVTEVLNSPVIADLRRQRAEVLRSKGEVEARYGPKHPEAVRVGDQLADLDTQIAAESRRIVSSLQTAAAATQARTASLRGALKQLATERSDNARNAVLADSYEREAAAKRALYDKMSQMSLESMQAARVSIAQAEIVDRARPPERPTSPNKPLLYALSLIVALAVGSATIAVQEMLSGGFRSIEDAEAELGLPVLGAIPKVPRNANPAHMLIDRPTSMFAESLRIVRAAVIGMKNQPPPKIIAITSALPSEGKTTTAVAFARALAIANTKTLLIECDVRRAAVRHIVDNPPTTAGLVEVLHGEVPVEAAIEPGDVPNLDQLLVLEPHFSAEDLFGDGSMEQLLKELSGRYTHIVLDLPPLMGLADGRFLAVLADAVMLAVKWNSTPAAAVTSALNWLRSDGSRPVGIVFTMVDSTAQSAGGLYYYSKKYSDYYQQA